MAVCELCGRTVLDLASRMTRPPALLILIALAGCGEPPPAPPVVPKAAVAPAVPPPFTPRARRPEPLPDVVRVRLETAAGPITLALDARHAPVTTANFVRYVDEGRFDGTSFYRAAASKGAPGRGFIQGGIRRSYRRMLPPIAHEPTSTTGIRHEAGAISMARGEYAGAMGDFFITTSAIPIMDAQPGYPGYAAFGRVTAGLDVARAILARATIPNAGRGAMRGQMIVEPVPIIQARRIE